MTITQHDNRMTIRLFETKDRDAVVALFTRINRELAPADLRERFEEYISRSIRDELDHLSELFSADKRNAFWVVEAEGRIVGMFGIERRDAHSTELRRMYLDRAFRGRGLAQQMMACAEAQARQFQFSELVLSTSAIQEVAIAFYRKCGYSLTRTELADSMSTKTVGGGINRFHFHKML